jgi:lipoic acid synthetase
MSVLKKPDWLKVRYSEDVEELRSIFRRRSINTVCESALCPNIGDCFSKKTATFLILGGICTRNCRFCEIKKGEPEGIDPSEPKRIRETVERLKLEYVVITSVTRDDLPDYGAGHFVEVVREIKSFNPAITVELLIPDFMGNYDSLKAVANSGAEVVGHNIETVPRLYPKVRPKADYKRSLNVLKTLKDINPNIFTKSGLMVGLGESDQEVFDTIEDLYRCKCDVITIGQYLQPSRKCLAVEEYIHPEKYEEYREYAYRMGFKEVLCGPFVRSSYKSGEVFKKLLERQDWVGPFRD